MAHYTPAPWTAVWNPDGSTFTIHRARREGRLYPPSVATIWPHGAHPETQKANSDLIASSPDLLEALEWLTEMAGYAMERLTAVTPELPRPGLRDAILQAQVAIDKAKGG